ncbi:MFS transporter [Rummeliibacillus sp. NPDC094406]|uniref:MFS transporter n=1 Tax=Rummeliibacillus sp. NPDC094406 TaxID=3364511 RepID=UPI00380ED185
MWRSRNVWIILSGELIAGLGLWAGIIGNLEFMQEGVPSDFMKSLILASGLLAGILVGPYAGRIIDQSKKKTVLIISGAGRVISVVFMFIALATDSISWMIVFLVTMQISAAFYFPALQAALPLIVEEKDLLQLNGWDMNISTIARVAGTALAGLVLVYAPISALYGMSMIAYIILLLLTFMLKIPETKDDLKQNSVEEHKDQGSFKEVFPMLKRDVGIKYTLILSYIPVLFIGSFNLLVISISEIQDSSSIKGLIYTVEGISFMLGSVAIKYIGSKWKTNSILFFSLFVIGAAELLLHFAHIPAMSLITFGLFGFSVGCFFPTVMTIFQKQVPKEYHGRFFSFRNMLDRTSFQIVLLSTGALLDLIGLENMVLFFGTLSICITLYYLLQMKKNNIHIETAQKAA